jgi:choline dehydrogenase-like flavoprotein
MRCRPRHWEIGAIPFIGNLPARAELPDGEFLPPLPMRPIDEYLLSALAGLRETGIRAIPNRKAIETRPDAPNVCPQCGLCVHGCETGSIYKFSSRLLPLIAGRQNYRIRYDTKVIALRRAASSNRIESVECLDTRTRETFSISADVFVIAGGALETARVAELAGRGVAGRPSEFLRTSRTRPAGQCAGHGVRLTLEVRRNQGDLFGGRRRSSSDPAISLRT